MRISKVPRSIVVLSLALTACPAVDVSSPTPLDRFYFPSALAHLDNPLGPDGGNGILLVASANFDKRFAAGSLMAVNLDALPVSLPAFGTTPPSPVQLPALRSPAALALGTDGGFPDTVLIAPFAGQMAVQPLAANRFRAFVPTRAEGMRVHFVDLAVDAEGTLRLSCFGGDGGARCLDSAPSLTKFELSTDGLPRAPGPFGVALRRRTCSTAMDCGSAEAVGSGLSRCEASQCVVRSSDGGAPEPAIDVLVTHLTQADSPVGSGTNPRGYLVKLKGESLEVGAESFINLGPGGTHGVAVGSRWSFVSGRLLNPSGNLIRLVDSTTGAVVSSGLESSFRVAEARGIALSADERRVYLIGRTPDSLLVASVDDPTSPFPRLQVVRGIPLAAGPNDVAVLSRPGRGDLLAITCTTAGVLALYDDEVGEVAVEVPGVGVQPFGLSVDRRGRGARMYVSNFQDGRIAVVDVPDLDRPQEARLVAHLGLQQLCLIRPSDQSCGGGLQDAGSAP